MKRVSYIILICICSLFLKGQKGFDPNIIILLPEIVEFSDEIEEEIKFLEEKWIYKKKAFYLNNLDSLKNIIVENDTMLDNFKTHYLNQLDFSRNLNFTNFIIKQYASSFQDSLSIDFLNLLVKIYPSKLSYDLKFFSTLAKIENADYIVFSPLLSVSKNGEDLLVKLIFKMYVSNENRIINIADLSTDNYNSYSVEIEDNQIDILFDDIYSISQIRNIIKQKGDSSNRMINKQRNTYLSKLFEEGKRNDTIKGIIAFSDLNININNYYTGLYNSRSNQLLTFFIEKFANTDSKVNKSEYKLNLVYFEKKSNKWKYKFIIKDASSSANLSKDERIESMFYNIEYIEFFKEKSIGINDRFWDKKLFIKYSARF